MALELKGMQVEVVERRPLRLPPGVLDGFLGDFPPGQIVLLDSGTAFVQTVVLQAAAMALLQGEEVVYVDGGNSLNPHHLVNVGRPLGLPREEALRRVHVARAFTVHQMATLLMESLEPVLVETQASLLILAHLPELFLDEEVPTKEAYHLLRRSMEAVRDLTRARQLVTIITNVGIARLHRRRPLARVLHQGVDRVVRFLPRRGYVIAEIPGGGRLEYRPVAPNQRTLDEFLEVDRG